MATIDDFASIAQYHAEIKAAAGILGRAHPEFSSRRHRAPREEITAPILPARLHGKK